MVPLKPLCEGYIGLICLQTLNLGVESVTFVPEQKLVHHQTVVGAPLDRIGIDILGPLPRTSKGNEYIIVLCDYFSKWAEAYAVPNHTALTVADKIVNEFICRFGIPKQIHSDQGREFE